MKISQNKYILLTPLLCLLVSIIGAQTATLQVVSKVKKHSLPWKDQKRIEINGQYADIKIVAWDQPMIEGVTELIAKHSDQTTAEKDVGTLISIFEERKKALYIGNQLVLSNKGAKPSSNLKAKMTFRVPNNCPIVITNSFGNIEVEGLHHSLQITSRFSKLKVDQVSGKTKLNTSFGSITGQRLTGQVTVIGNRTEVYLNELKGTYNLESKYGQITLSEDTTKKYELRIKGNKTDVFFLEDNLLAHDFDLMTAYGNITIPNQQQFSYVSDTDDLKHVKHHIPAPQSIIVVDLSYGNISIK